MTAITDEHRHFLLWAACSRRVAQPPRQSAARFSKIFFTIKEIFFLFSEIFFTICAEKVCYKLCNMYYKLCNMRYKLSNMCYKLCNKNFLIGQEKIAGRE